MTLTLEREAPTVAVRPEVEPGGTPARRDPRGSRPEWSPRLRRWSVLLVLLLLGAVTLLVVTADDAHSPTERVTTVDLEPVETDAKPASQTPVPDDTAGAGAKPCTPLPSWLPSPCAEAAP